MRRRVVNRKLLTTNGNDKDTVMLMHFDGNMNNDAYTNSYAGFYMPGVYYTSGKFGNGLYQRTLAWPSIYTTNHELLDLLRTIFQEDFTVDYWCYRNGYNTTEALEVAIGENHSAPSCPVLGLGLYSLSSNTFILHYLTDRTGNDSGFSVQYQIPAVYQWNHIAFEKNGDILSIFFNGELLGHPSTFNPDAFNSKKNSLNFFWDGWLNQFSNSHIDEFRISSIARYKGKNFIPPIKPYGE